jgi:hypothetical protein
VKPDGVDMVKGGGKVVEVHHTKRVSGEGEREKYSKLKTTSEKVRR